MKKIVAGIVVALLLSTLAWAQQKGAIELKSTAEVEVIGKNAKGEKEIKRMDAAKANVVPGDTVIFTNLYTNQGDKPVADVVINNAVPEHMLYADGTAEGKDSRIEFSVDKGKTFGPAGKLKIKDAEGKEKIATAADYTSIRWTLQKPVARGGKGSVSFRAKVK